MACEDYPCCGHELGCCPDFDEDGRQLNMICVCGAKLPVNNRSSLCNGCLYGPEPDDADHDLRLPRDDFDEESGYYPDPDDFDDEWVDGEG